MRRERDPDAPGASGGSGAEPAGAGRTRAEEAGADRRAREREGAGRIVWLAFEVAEDGRVRTVVTLDRDGELVRERREAESLEAAGRTYGEGFADVVRKCLEAGSRSGRWRP